MTGRAKPARARPARKIEAGLQEATRALTLRRAVHELDGFEMTEQEAVDVLARVDAVASSEDTVRGIARAALSGRGEKPEP